MHDKRVNICLIGIGSFGNKLKSRLDKIPHCRLICGYHPDEEKAKRWDQKIGASDLKAVFDRQDIDAFILATPNDVRLEYIPHILKREKHVFIEKPLADNLKKALRIYNLAQKYSNLIVMVGHSFRRYRSIRKTKEIINAGIMGQITNVNMNYSHGGIFNFSKNEWRLSATRHTDGPLITTGIHLIDVLHYLFGPIESVYAIVQNLSNHGEAPDSSSVLMRLKNSAVVFMQTNYNIPSERWITIHGTEGTLYIDREEIYLRMGRDADRIPSKRKKINIEMNDPIMEELQEYVNAVRMNAQIETGVGVALDAMIVVDACRKSNKVNKAIFTSEYKLYFNQNKE